MNYDELASEELLRKLEFAGRYPDPEFIDMIWERRPEMEPLVLALFGEAYSDDWDDPQHTEQNRSVLSRDAR